MAKAIRGFEHAGEHARLLLRSYKKLTGAELLVPETGRSEAESLDAAPIVVLSHGTEPDPILNYGNRLALRLWETDWDDFVSMPSKQTAEQANRLERERFLRQVAEQGYVSDYTGIRISRNGQKFVIMEATVWNVTDDAGRYRGQAAAFARYRQLDGGERGD